MSKLKYYINEKNWIISTAPQILANYLAKYKAIAIETKVPKVYHPKASTTVSPILSEYVLIL